MEGEKTQTTDLTIYYDGACPLCSLEIGYYETCAGSERINFVNVADGNVPEDLTRDKALQRFHIRQADGTLLSGARAFIAVWDKLNNWRWAAKLAKLPGVTWVMEGAYRLFLHLRPVLSWLAGKLGAKARSPH